MTRARSHGWIDTTLSASEYLLKREALRKSLRKGLQYRYRYFFKIKVGNRLIFAERYQNPDPTRPHFCRVYDFEAGIGQYDSLLMDLMKSKPTNVSERLGAATWEQPPAYPRILRVDTRTYKSRDEDIEGGYVGTYFVVSQWPDR